MHKELKILTLEQRRNLNHAVQCYKENTVPESGLHYMFVKAEHVRPMRRGPSKNVMVLRIDTETGCKGFSFRGPVYWNNPDSKLKNKENKDTFTSADLKDLLWDVNHPG